MGMIAVHPTTSPSSSAIQARPGSHRDRSSSAVGTVGLEGGVPGGEAFGVDRGARRRGRGGDGADGHVGWIGRWGRRDGEDSEPITTSAAWGARCSRPR